MNAKHNIRFGCHVSTSNGYLSAVELSLALGANSAQIWVGNSKGYASKLISAKEYKPVAKMVKENDFFLISHSPYILNFARPLQDSETGLKALNRYLTDLINITNLGGVGSVLHMGCNVKELRQTMQQAYQQFADNLQWIIDRAPPNATIILENMAGGGSRMCCELQDWADFWNGLSPTLQSRIKWCIDTAHLYATGEYDISKRSQVNNFYSNFNDLIGWKNVLCIHYNGSKTKFGSHTDRHACIGPINSGFIKSKGLFELANIARETGKPLIFETPSDEYSITEQFVHFLYGVADVAAKQSPV